MRELDHIVLNVKDVEKIIAFYTDVVGLAPERVGEYRTGKAPFPSVRINKDTIIDLFPEPLSEGEISETRGRPNLNHLCLNLDKSEWDELRQRLDEHDVTIDVGPVERWGAHGNGISIYFRDPEQNVIEARHYEGQDPTKPCLLGS